MRSFCPISAGSFMVQTTLPMMRPSSMLSFPRGGEFGFMQSVEHHFVDDADDRGVHWAVLAFGGVACGAAGYDQNSFAESRVHCVDCDQVARFIVALRGNRLHDEELLAFQAHVLARRNHGADNAGENYRASVCLKSRNSVAQFSSKSSNCGT